MTSAEDDPEASRLLDRAGTERPIPLKLLPRQTT